MSIQTEAENTNAIKCINIIQNGKKKAKVFTGKKEAFHFHGFRLDFRVAKAGEGSHLGSAVIGCKGIMFMNYCNLHCIFIITKCHFVTQ